MLTWIEMENATGYIGFDDDCPCYFVKQDENGWYWQDSWGYGYGGFATAEQAKAECEKDLPTINPEWTGFTQEELDEIKACLEAHERMEKEKGLA